MTKIILTVTEQAEGAIKPLTVLTSPRIANQPVSVQKSPALKDAEIALQRSEYELSQARQELAKLRDEFEAAVALEKEAAFQDAKLAHVRDDEKRHLVLLELIRSSQVSFTKTLSEFEQISLLIAKSALKPIFDGSELFSERISQSVSRQIKALKQDTVISVMVKAELDINLGFVRSELEKLGITGIQIEAAPSQMSNEIQINLRVGHIEIGIGDYWKAVEARLHALVEGYT